MSPPWARRERWSHSARPARRPAHRVPERHTPEASFFYRWFREAAARSGYPVEDHAAESRALVADLRAAVTRRGDAPARSLVSRLLAESPEFAALWELHDVAVLRRRRKRIRHPEVGLLEFDCQFLVDEERAHILAIFSPVPGTPTAERLTLLALATIHEAGTF